MEGQWLIHIHRQSHEHRLSMATADHSTGTTYMTVIATTMTIILVVAGIRSMGTTTDTGVAAPGPRDAQGEETTTITITIVTTITTTITIEDIPVMDTIATIDTDQAVIM